MVVLPAPLGPTSATIWPGRAVNEMLRKAQRGVASSAAGAASSGGTSDADTAIPAAPTAGTDRAAPARDGRLFRSEPFESGAGSGSRPQRCTVESSTVVPGAR